MAEDNEIFQPRYTHEEKVAFKKRVKDWEKAESIHCTNIEEALNICHRWLYLEPADTEFIEVAVAAVLDRELPGDPVWMLLVTPSGGMKSELLRALSVYPKSYTLDLLTPHTFVSGLTRRNPKTKELEPVGGLLKHMDGKCLMLKDFTTVLSSDEGTRNEIYGQLRSIYDGYFEKGFGTLPEPIRVRATIGLVAGVTPAIDKYHRMAGLLGERFLKVRSSPDRRKAARRASENTGLEQQMRHELKNAFKTFFNSLDFAHVPDLDADQESELLEIGLYLGRMRAHIWANWFSGDIIDMDIVEPEIPTRVTKQLRKLAQLLAIIRGHQTIESEDIDSIRRVAADTANQKRQKIVEAFRKVGLDIALNLSDIAGMTPGLHYRAARNQLILMTALDIVQQDEHDLYSLKADFKDLVEKASIYSSPVHAKKEPKKGVFSALTGGLDIPPPTIERGLEALLKTHGEVSHHEAARYLKNLDLGLDSYNHTVDRLEYRNKLTRTLSGLRIGPAWSGEQ